MSSTPARTTDTIDNTLDRDHFMTAEESREFGIIDRVETVRAEPAADAK